MSKSILVIDDEKVITDISKRKLTASGYTVEVANNGEEALRVLETFNPDLILSDVEMPQMNGYTFMVEKNKNPLWAEIPVVVLTAYHETEPIFRRHRIKDYLVKPIQLEDLVSKVNQILN